MEINTEITDTKITLIKICICTKRGELWKNGCILPHLMILIMR
jgi:hypothetical protein